MNAPVKIEQQKTIDVTVIERAERARELLALAANDIKAVKSVVDISKAASVYAKAQHASKESTRHVAAILFEAEAQLGALLKQEGVKATGTKGIPQEGMRGITGGKHEEPPVKEEKTALATPEQITQQPAKPIPLKELGISKKQSVDAQLIADIRDTMPETFDKLVKGETTLSRIKREKKDFEREQNRQKNLDKVAEIYQLDKVVSKVDVTFEPVVTIGNHTIIFGDNTDPAVIEKLPKHAALAFCDPPYNSTDNEWDGGHIWAQDYLSDICDIVAVTPGISSIHDFMRNTSMPYKWSVSTHISNGMTRGALGFGNWMYTALFSRLDSIHRNAQDASIVSIKSSDAHEGHIAGKQRQKPPEYLTWLFNLLTDENDIIIDAFGGSGTSAVVAERIGRKSYTVEMDKDSFISICSRLHTHING